MSHSQQADTHHPPTTVRQYVMIGVILTVITIVELAVSYMDLGDLLIPILIILSAFKFAAVVAFFMHLRFDNALLTRLFVFGFLLAAAILVSLIALFWTNETDRRATNEEVRTPAPVEHRIA